MLRPLIIATLLVGTCAGQAPRTTTDRALTNSQQDQGRYQMLAAPIADLSSRESTVFILDTATGKVWKFTPGATVKGADGKTRHVPDSFVEIKMSAPDVYYEQ